MLLALYSYDAYGSPGQVLSAATARISAPLAAAIAEANALRYAGYAYDAHSGLYYLSKRYYDPATAQFLTKDPAKADGEGSPYQYCGGDPVGKVDPSGLRAYSKETQTEWKYVAAYVLFGGGANFEYRIIVTWYFTREAYSYVKVRIEMRRGMTSGGAFSVYASKVMATANVRKPNGLIFGQDAGSLDYGLQAPGYEVSNKYGPIASTKTTNPWSKYWVASVSAVGVCSVAGGIGLGRPIHKVPVQLPNPFGRSRPSA